MNNIFQVIWLEEMVLYLDTKLQTQSLQKKSEMFGVI